MRRAPRRLVDEDKKTGKIKETKNTLVAGFYGTPRRGLGDGGWWMRGRKGRGEKEEEDEKEEERTEEDRGGNWVDDDGCARL